MKSGVIMIDYDMHIHSRASDGLLYINEILGLARDKGLKGIALTDHDTLSGIEEGILMSPKFGLEFIPGVELSTDYKGVEVHILGYYIDYKNSKIADFLNDFKSSRRDRAMNIVKKLNDLGYNLSFSDIMEEAGGTAESLGRPHIARVLVKKGYFEDMPQVFDRLLGFGKPGYIERRKIDIEEAITLIIDAGGIPVLAHPKLIRKYGDDLLIEAFVKELKSMGLMGIEVSHSKQRLQDTNNLRLIAGKYDLAVTGGSDCHGKLENGRYLLGNWGVSEYEFKNILALRR